MAKIAHGGLNISRNKIMMRKNTTRIAIIVALILLVPLVLTMLNPNAHLGGKEAVGVVVSFKDGEFDKHGYRTFIIRSARAGDDIGALKEVLERRLKHRDWPYPDIILTDGGEAHRKVAEDLAGRFSGGRIRVFSVVKDEKHRPKEVLPFSTDGHDNRDIFFRVNAEAHRFAIRTHTKRRKI